MPRPPHIVDPAAPLAFVLSAAARKLAKFYASALRESPVTPSQLFFLRQLWREDGLPLTDLRERAQLDATSATWLADQLKGLAVGVVLGGPLAALVLWLMGSAGSAWWLWAWGAWIAFNLLVLVLYPTVIAPWFNKF